MISMENNRVVFGGVVYGRSESVERTMIDAISRTLAGPLSPHLSTHTLTLELLYFHWF